MFLRSWVGVGLVLVVVGMAAVPANAKNKKEKFQQVKPIIGPTRAPTKEEAKWADKMLKKLSLEEKIGQMIEVRGIMGFFNAEDPQQQQLVNDIRKYHLGAVHLTSTIDGLDLVRNGPYAAAMTANILQQAAGEKVPLILSADFERGPSMRLSAVPAFPAAMAFGATHNPEYAERFGRIVAEESRAMGVEWNFFPVADVNANPRNPVINTRSFGEDPAQVSAMVTAYIKGSHAGGMLTALKHFPGHGDTDTDSHLDISRVNAPLERLNRVELPPFEAGIQAGSDAVMIAHVAFPALEPDPNKISTISHNVVTGLLRDRLGFKGVIVSDAMEMKGLTKLYPPGDGNPAGRAAVDAVKAGQDFLELPSDLDGTYNGLLEAVKSGEISKQQIDGSVRRILLVKAKAGLNKGDMVDVEQVQYHVGKPSSYALAQEVAEHAVTLVRDDNHLLPMARSVAPIVNGTSQPKPAYLQQEPAGGGQAANLGAANPLLAVLFVDDVHGENGRMLERQIRGRVPNAKVIYVDDRTAALDAEGIAALLPQYQKVIAAVYSVPHSGRAGGGQTSVNAMAMHSTAGTVLQNILNAAGERTVVLAMGSPYTILDFPSIRSYVCTFSTAQTSELAAVEALFGEIAIHGKLPVTLPDIAPLGEGIDRDISAAAASGTGGRQ